MSKTPQQKSQLTGTPARKSALLTIAVAGAMLNSPQPAISAKKIESKETVIQQIVGDRDLSPETRAYFILRLAEGYLAGIDGSNYVPNRNDPNRSTSFLKPGVWETMLEPWALEVSSDTWLNNREIGNWHEKSGHADEAVQTAMIQMEKSSDKYSKHSIAPVSEDQRRGWRAALQ